MYKHTVTYKDFDGNDRTETMYFNLTAVELSNMQLAKDGGLAEYWEKIISANDGYRILEAFQHLILAAYGEKSDDGRFFMKTDEIRKRFECSAAFDAYMQELTNNEALLKEFADNIVPSDSIQPVKA